MSVNIEQAARAGGRAGLLGDGETHNIASWPAAAQAAFAENYAKGRRCRLVAQGRATLVRPIDTGCFAGMSRKALEQEFADRPELQSEFGNSAAFVAFVTAESKGLVKIATPRVVRAGA